MEKTLAQYLEEQLNNKSRDTRIVLTNARIERQTALMKWLARDWRSYHRTYFMKSYNHTV